MDRDILISEPRIEIDRFRIGGENATKKAVRDRFYVMMQNSRDL